MRRTEKRNILALECAVGGGSVALIGAGHTSAVSKGTHECSRAETIISVIARLLDDVSLTLPDLDMIAVSTGPGSYSGIRIGLSTSMGLGDALSIPCVGVSVLDAMVGSAEIDGRLIAAVPVGRNDVAFRPYEIRKDGVRTALGDSEMLSITVFVERMKALSGFAILAQKDLFVSLTGHLALAALIDAGTGLAESVGRFASLNDMGSTSLRPIYLRNSSPRILPRAF